MQGPFSAYVNIHTGHVAIAKIPNELEYEQNYNFSPLTRNKSKRALYEEIEQYFSINYIPDEERIIIV